MYKLYHQPLCPFSRKVRILLSCKEIPFELAIEDFWNRRKEFIAMNAIGSVPVLFDINSGHIISDSSVIVEYVEEKYSSTAGYIGESINQRAEARRIQAWFDHKFFNEVTKYILYKRFFNRFVSGSEVPTSEGLMMSKRNLVVHLNYIEFLLEDRQYLAGDKISIADFAAAGQISVLDYFGDINWNHYEIVKDWYSLVKSQKSFSAILQDKVSNVSPPEWYSKIDF